MTDATGIGVLGALGGLILVGSAIVVHRRSGRPIARYALIWSAFFVAAFVIALTVGHR